MTRAIFLTLASDGANVNVLLELLLGTACALAEVLLMSTIAGHVIKNPVV